MGADVIAGDGELVIVLLEPGWESDYAGNPPVHEIATLGVLEDSEELEDGRYNITVSGTERIRLLPPDDGEIRPGKLYRERAIETARERCPDSGDEEAIDAIDRLRARWEELWEKSGRPGRVALSSTPSRFDVFVNRIAHTIDIPPRLKQALLEEDDVLVRAERLDGLMRKQLEFWRTLARYRELKPDDPAVN